jgi:hypothetical protein
MNQTNISEFYHGMPSEAVEAIEARGVEGITLESGVTRIEMSGHDKGVAYRFFIHPVYNPTKSEELGYEVFDDIEMIEWLIDRKSKPTEQVRLLPPDLLKWNRVGDLVGGRYKDAYESWKTGKASPGTPLRRWGLLGDGQVASLEAEGIFTVEQFNELGRDRIAARYPQEYVEAHDRAEKFLAAQAIRAENVETVERLKKLEAERAEMAAKIEALQALVETKKEDAPSPVKKKVNLEAKKND